MGPPKFFDASLTCMPQPEDSGGHPHPHHDGCFMLASAYVKTLAIRNKLISKLYQLSGHTVAPTAYRILWVRFTSFVRQHNTSGSAVGATLDTGGWLALSRPGLSPGKMRQAYLGAKTTKLSGGLLARPLERLVGQAISITDHERTNQRAHSCRLYADVAELHAPTGVRLQAEVGWRSRRAGETASRVRIHELRHLRAVEQHGVTLPLRANLEFIPLPRRSSGLK